MRHCFWNPKIFSYCLCSVRRRVVAAGLRAEVSVSFTVQIESACGRLNPLFPHYQVKGDAGLDPTLEAASPSHTSHLFLLAGCISSIFCYWNRSLSVCEWHCLRSSRVLHRGLQCRDSEFPASRLQGSENRAWAQEPRPKSQGRGTKPKPTVNDSRVHNKPGVSQIRSRGRTIGNYS